MKVIQISNCQDCPYLYKSNDTRIYFCGLSNPRTEIKKYDADIPEWCPLNDSDSPDMKLDCSKCNMADDCLIYQDWLNTKYCGCPRLRV